MAQQEKPDIATEVKRGVLEAFDDSDAMRPYWEKGHEHLWRKTWEKITSAVGRWLIVAIVSGGGVSIVIYAVKAGWIK